MQLKLDIYVEPECSICDRAYSIARMVESTLPAIEVSLIDLTKPDAVAPPSVFAVPTYVLNGQTISLGNPDERELLARLESEVNSGGS